MNQCILMAEVIQPAQTRYAPDQTAIAEAVVQYRGLKPDDPAGTLKIVGWGKKAEDVHTRCTAGARVIIEGRLRMNTVERPEGFKEKLVELNVSQVYTVGDRPQGHEPVANHAPPTNPGPPPAPRTDAGLGGRASQDAGGFEEW